MIVPWEFRVWKWLILFITFFSHSISINIVIVMTNICYGEWKLPNIPIDIWNHFIIWYLKGIFTVNVNSSLYTKFEKISIRKLEIQRTLSLAPYFVIKMIMLWKIRFSFISSAQSHEISCIQNWDIYYSNEIIKDSIQILSFFLKCMNLTEKNKHMSIATERRWYNRVFTMAKNFSVVLPHVKIVIKVWY